MLNYAKLFKPYTRDGCTLDMCVNWMQKTMPQIPISVIEQAITDVMSELAGGKSYLYDCPCGCGVTKDIHNTINHVMLAKAVAIHDEANRAFIKVLQAKDAKRLEAQLRLISKTNRQYIKMMRPPITKRSEALRFALWSWGKIRGWYYGFRLLRSGE